MRFATALTVTFTTLSACFPVSPADSTPADVTLGFDASDTNDSGSSDGDVDATPPIEATAGDVTDGADASDVVTVALGRASLCVGGVSVAKGHRATIVVGATRSDGERLWWAPGRAR